MAKLNFCDPQKCLKNRSTNGRKNVQKSDQKTTPKNDQKMSDSYHKELPNTVTVTKIIKVVAQ